MGDASGETEAAGYLRLQSPPHSRTIQLSPRALTTRTFATIMSSCVPTSEPGRRSQTAAAATQHALLKYSAPSAPRVGPHARTPHTKEGPRRAAVSDPRSHGAAPREPPANHSKAYQPSWAVARGRRAGSVGRRSLGRWPWRWTDQKPSPPRCRAVALLRCRGSRRGSLESGLWAVMCKERRTEVNCGI